MSWEFPHNGCKYMLHIVNSGLLSTLLDLSNFKSKKRVEL